MDALLAIAPPVWYCSLWVAMVPVAYWCVRLGVRHGIQDRERARARKESRHDVIGR